MQWLWFWFLDITLYLPPHQLGFSRKKNCTTLVENIDFFEFHPLNFQSNLPWSPWNFHFFFCIYPPPGNPRFFLNFWSTPWNSNKFCSTSLEFSIGILNRGLQFFFWKSPISHIIINLHIYTYSLWINKKRVKLNRSRKRKENQTPEPQTQKYNDYIYTAMPTFLI